MGRREHNRDHIKAFLNQHYPDSAPGSPDPEQPMDDNKKGSRVILKRGGYERADSALSAQNRKKPPEMRVMAEGEIEADPAKNRSFDKLVDLFANRSAELSEWHHLAARLILLNTNNAGGWREMERLESVNDQAAKDVARLCRSVVGFVLDELDRQRFWLDIGTDKTYRSKHHEEGQRRSRVARRTREDSYPPLYRAWLAEVEKGTPKVDAYFSVAKKKDTYPTKVKEAVAHCRAKEKEDEERAC